VHEKIRNNSPPGHHLLILAAIFARSVEKFLSQVENETIDFLLREPLLKSHLDITHAPHILFTTSGSCMPRTQSEDHFATHQEFEEQKVNRDTGNHSVDLVCRKSLGYVPSIIVHFRIRKPQLI